MSCLFRIILTHDLGDYGFEAIDLLIGFNSAEVQMQLLLRALTAILTNNPLNPIQDEEEEDDDDHVYPPILKSLVLQLLLIITTVSESFQNYNFAFMTHFNAF